MESRPSQLRRVIAPAVAVAALVLCVGLGAGVAVAQDPDSPAARPNDPLEGMNRGLYAVHRSIDRIILRPVAKVYLAVTPRFVRRGLHNCLVNLGEPITVVNDVLQLKIGKAARATTRFVANSTVGVAGLFDVASKAGVPYHTADFGQTLGRYGVPAGPYIFIPVLGPSTLRDAGGRVVDAVADPVSHVHFDGEHTFRTGRVILGAIDTRATFDKDLEELDRSATDPYVTLRSVYLQNRQSFINGGQVDVQSLPSFGPESPQPGVSRPRSEAEETGDAVNQEVAVVSESFFRSIR